MDEGERTRPTAHDVTTRDDHRLRVWERTTAADPEEAVLFVHGATYSALPVFDPPVREGYGWMSFAAERGQAAFAVDLRGYGESEAPTAYDDPPEENPPALSHRLVARDIADVTAYLREELAVDRLHYVGFSAGTWRARALYDCFDPDFATVTLAGGEVRDVEVGDDPEGPAYEPHTREEFFDHRLGQIPDDEDPDRWIGGEEFTADEVVSAVWEAVLDTDQAMDDDPETIRKPLRTRERAYSPGAIDDPTLVVRGTEDATISREGALRLYDGLGARPHRRRYAEIGGGTHFIFAERTRRRLFEVTHDFQRRH